MHNMPLNARQRCDLELLITGAFAPLDGFMGQSDYQAVLAHMRLANGALWPLPVTLDIPEALAQRLQPGEILRLDRQDGTPLARMRVTEIYTADPMIEAQAVYGSTDLHHAGVAELLRRSRFLAAGAVEPIDAERFAIARLSDFLPSYVPLHALRERLRALSGPVIAFQTRNPMHHAHRALTLKALDAIGGHLLIHPAIGPTRPGDIDPAVRMRAYRALLPHYPRQPDGRPRVLLAGLPLAMRMAGPREALWHALIRQNFGATHFIVGRAHADPGANPQRSDGFWHAPYEAQALLERHAQELGIVPVNLPELRYSRARKQYLPAGSSLALVEDTQVLSGSELRRRLARHEEIPEWFSPPEVIRILRQGVQRSDLGGLVILFTGLSGAGKSTLAGTLANHLREHDERQVTVLDGDVVRGFLSKGLGFSREDRNENIRRIGFVASLIARHRGIALISAIAPYAESRAQIRALVEEAGGRYCEIHVAAPLSVCKERDPKQLYRRAEQGEIQGMTGVDDAYEAPLAPDLRVYPEEPPLAAVARIRDWLVRDGAIGKISDEEQAGEAARQTQANTIWGQP